MQPSEPRSAAGWTPEQEKEVLAQAELAIIGSPLALGLAGFGLTLFVASVPWAGFFPEEKAYFALPLALVFGAITLIAGLWGYRKHDTFTATTLGALGAFWLSWGALQWMLLARFLPLGADQADLIGTFFLAWAVVAGLLLIAALAVNLAMVLALAGTTITFACLTIGQFADSTTWINIAGWAGIVTAVIAGYTVLADTINSTLNRTVLPMVEIRALPVGA